MASTSLLDRERGDGGSFCGECADVLRFLPCRRPGVALLLAVLAALGAAQDVSAQPTKIYVEGSPKNLKAEVVSLLRSTAPPSVPSAKQPAARIRLKKEGGATVKWGDAVGVLPGPSAADIVGQFRAWAQTAVVSRTRTPRGPGVDWPAVVQAFSQRMARENETRARSGFAAAPLSVKLMLFAGPNHKTYLGCLNCSSFETDSVKNTFGQHGSKFASESILNAFSEFGGRFGAFSPCNPYSADPPVIVDRQGNFYGRLTISPTHPQRVTGGEWPAWIEGVCAGQ